MVFFGVAGVVMVGVEPPPVAHRLAQATEVAVPGAIIVEWLWNEAMPLWLGLVLAVGTSLIIWTASFYFILSIIARIRFR